MTIERKEIIYYGYLTLEVKSNTDFSKIQIHFETLIRRIRIRVK